MRVGASHLTYCSNIHPGESWAELREALQRHTLVVKQRISPQAPFGLGLRLSALAASELSEPPVLAEFQAFLAANGLYVFTINGFPYGQFHDGPVKQAVYRPDWTDPRRLAYSNQLADLLLALLPEDPSLSGSISTVPGAYKPDAAAQGARARIVEYLLQHVAHLAGIEARTGRTLVLALEPEPCCMLETIAETVAFFQDDLRSTDAVRRLAELIGTNESTALRALQRHLGVCVDLCHAGVEFEDPLQAIVDLRAAGIAIAKLQVTAGLIVAPVDEASTAALAEFADPVYLHQVVERDARGYTRHVDLAEAFAATQPYTAEREWRVHFHVPLFLAELGRFRSTQEFVRRVLALHREHAISAHLEVETYTWSVLPAAYRDRPIADAIIAELDWVRRELQ